MAKKKKEILFRNLPFSLGDMEKKVWIIDLFHLNYKGYQYYVILTRYTEHQRKPSPYVKAKIEMVRKTDTTQSIIGYIDFYNVHFFSAQDSCDFFDVKRGDANRDLFNDFSNVFEDFIPREMSKKTDKTERQLLGSRAEGNNPKAIYCYDVRRNETRKDGKPNIRSIENSNKAESLRPKLFKRYASDLNLSFFFSENIEDERTEREIMDKMALR